MTTVVLNRRNLLAAGGSVLATGVSGLLLPARAQGLAPTHSMSGGANNYRKGAPVVDRIGKGGFWMSGTVRRAGDGTPLAGQRIQIWAHTTEGAGGVGAAFEAPADKVRFGRAASDGPAGCGAWPSVRWRGVAGGLSLTLAARCTASAVACP